MALPEPEPEPLTYEDWHPFSEERAQLAAEFEALRLREDAYAAEWDRYAVDCNRIYHEDISRWANWRADLMDEKDAIELAHHEYAKRYESLVDNVSAEACKKQENNR